MDYKPYYSFRIFEQKNPDVSRDELTTYWKKQLIPQLYKKPSRFAKLSNQDILTDKPFMVMEADIMYLPLDEFENIPFKFVLTVIDLASRFKIAVPVESDPNPGSGVKQEHVLESFKAIFSQIELPHFLITDGGNEFRGKLDKVLRNHGVTHISRLPGHHLSYVESFNGQLAKLMFKSQSFQEHKTGKTSREWVEILSELINQMNNTVSTGINMKPVDAIKLDVVPQINTRNFTKSQLKAHIPINTDVRRLLESHELQDMVTGKIKTDAKRRITDTLWSLQIYRVIGYLEDLETSMATNRLVMHRIAKVNADGSTGEVYGDIYTFWRLQ